LQRLGQGWEFPAPVPAVPRQQGDSAGLDPRQNPVAVEFDLVEPVVALRRLGNQGCQLGQRDALNF
jgi:hypothetical protein